MEKAKLQIKCFEPIKAETADGRISTLHKAAQIELKINGMEHLVFKLMAYILPNSGTDLILGHKFLTENEAIINFKQGIIQLRDLSMEITLKNNTAPLNDPDRLTIQKSQLCTLQTHIQIGKDSPHEISKYLYDMALHNPTLGFIPGIEHKINIPLNSTQRSPQYKIPVAIENKTKMN